MISEFIRIFFIFSFHLLSEKSIGVVKNITFIAKDEGANFSWNPVRGVDGYRLYIYSNSSKDFVSQSISVRPSMSASRLINGKEYRFKVRAYKMCEGEELYGDFSDEIKVTPFSNDTRLKLNLEFLVLNSGETFTLVGSVMHIPQNLTWRSDNVSVVMVNENNGTLYALGTGTATIIAMGKNKGENASARIIVNREPDPPLRDIHPGRYKLNKNGVYTNNGMIGKTTLTFVGDLMSTAPQQIAARKADGTYHYDDSFKLVKSIFADSDLNVANLETVISHSFAYAIEQRTFMKVYNGNTQATFLDALRFAGFDALVAANNHAADAGPKGVFETLTQLKKYHLPVTGMFADGKSPRFILMESNGIKIAILSYTQKSYNGKDTMFSKKEIEVMLNNFSKRKLDYDIDAARADGAEWIVVYVHWGKQNTMNVLEDQIKTAQIIADAGADMIVGSHPHVLQRYDEIKTKDKRTVPVMYSLGNFCSSQNEVLTNRDSAIFRFTLQKIDNKVTIQASDYIPCLIANSYCETPNVCYKFVIVPFTANVNISSFQKNTTTTLSRISKIIGKKITKAF